MVRWYASFRRPRFLFLYGLQYHVYFVLLFGGILRTWPTYHNLLFNTVDLIGSAFTLKYFFAGN